MAEVGILRPDDRVELIEGEIVEMSPIGLRDAACVLALATLFRRVLTEDRASEPRRASDAATASSSWSAGGPDSPDALVQLEVLLRARFVAKSRVHKAQLVVGFLNRRIDGHHRQQRIARVRIASPFR